MSTTDVAPLRWVRYDGVYYAALLIPNNESPMHVPDEHCFVFFLDGESGAVVPESDVEPYDPHNLTRASHPDAVAGVALAEQILHGPTHAYSSPANTEVANNNNNSSSNNYKLDTRYDPTGVFAGNEDVALDEELELVYSPDDFYHNHYNNINNNNGSSNNDNITNAIDRERKVYTSAEHLGKENTEELLSNEMQETHSHAREYQQEQEQEQEQERNRRHSQHQQREHRHGHSHHRKKKSHKEHHSRSKVKHESVTLENEEDNESSDNNNNNNSSSSHKNKSHEVIATDELLAEEDHINKDNVTVEEGRNNHWREMEEEYYNNDNDNDGVVHVDNNNNHFRGDSNDREIMNRPTYRRGKTFRSGGLMSEALNALHSRASLVAPYLAQIRYYYKELREEAERSNRLLSVQEADVVREVEYLLHATTAKIRFLEQVHTTHVLQSDTLSHAEKHNAEQVLKETIRNLRNAVNMEHIIRELVQFIDKPPETKPEAKRRPLHMERFAFHDASIAFMLRNTLTNAIPREFTQELANKYREQRLWRERQLSLNNGLGKTGFYAIPKPMEHWNRSKELMVISHAPENQPVKPTGYIPRRFSESINKVEQNAIKRFTGQSSRDNMQMSREPLSMSEATMHGTNMYNNSLPSFMTTANNLLANTLAAASINFNNNNNNSTTSASSNVATNNNNTNNNTVTAGTSAAFQSPSRRLGQNYPAYYNFHDLAPSQTNDLERYRVNGLASANGVLGPVNLVDSYFNEQHSLPLEHEQEPLITPLHMGVDPNVDFAIEPDEVRDERREYGSNLHSNSRSYLYSASIRLPSQESHLYSVESTNTIQASEPYAHSATNQSNTNNNNNNNNNISSRPFYSVDYMDDTGGVPAPKSVPQEQQHHHHHHHHHHRNRSRSRSKSRSRSATTSRHVSRASSAASSVFSSSASASSHKSLSSAKAHKHRRHSRSRHRSKDISNSKSTNNRHKVSSRASGKKTNNTNTTAAMAIGGSKKKLDWRESAKRAILEQLTLYLRGLKGKTAVLSYDNFESVARKLLERAVSRESERTGVSMALQANNNSIPFLRETELMLKRSVDSYVTRHFIEPFRHASTKHSLRHRSAAQTMSQPHYEQVVNDNDHNNTNEENNHRGAEDSPVYD